MAHMQFVYEFNCIADEILDHESPSEQPVDDADTDLHQIEMEWGETQLLRDKIPGP